MGVRRSDFEDEYGNVDIEAYNDALDDWGDAKYQEWKDEQLERDIDERENEQSRGL